MELAYKWAIGSAYIYMWRIWSAEELVSVTYLACWRTSFCNVFGLIRNYSFSITHTFSLHTLVRSISHEFSDKRCPPRFWSLNFVGLIKIQRKSLSNWFFTTDSDFLTLNLSNPISNRLLIFQTINSIKLIDLKSEMSTALGCKAKRIRKLEFVATTWFLYAKCLVAFHEVDFKKFKTLYLTLQSKRF